MQAPLVSVLADDGGRLTSVDALSEWRASGVWRGYGGNSIKSVGRVLSMAGVALNTRPRRELSGNTLGASRNHKGCFPVGASRYLKRGGSKRAFNKTMRWQAGSLINAVELSSWTTRVSNSPRN